jgi:hypothetical protein
MTTIDDIAALRDCLYEVVAKNAQPLDSVEVVQVLKSISEEMYAAGIDEALRSAESRIKDWDHIASAWDLTWLTLFAYSLSKRHKQNIAGAEPSPYADRNHHALRVVDSGGSTHSVDRSE